MHPHTTRLGQHPLRPTSTLFTGLTAFFSPLCPTATRSLWTLNSGRIATSHSVTDTGCSIHLWFASYGYPDPFVDRSAPPPLPGPLDSLTSSHTASKHSTSSSSTRSGSTPPSPRTASSTPSPSPSLPWRATLARSPRASPRTRTRMTRPTPLALLRRSRPRARRAMPNSRRPALLPLLPRGPRASSRASTTSRRPCSHVAQAD